MPKFALDLDLVKIKAHSVGLETARLGHGPYEYISALFQRRQQRESGRKAIAGADHVKVESLPSGTLEKYVLGMIPGQSPPTMKHNERVC